MIKFEDGSKWMDKFVRVQWVDANCGGGWYGSGDVEMSVAPVETIGWISKIARSKLLGEYIAVSATKGLTQNGSKRNEYNQHMTIPLGWVKSIRKITV